MERRVLSQRYELLEPVGSGGMADVFRARDTLLDRTVAVKILRSHLANDGEFLSKFQYEAKGAARINHANIVNVYDVGEDNGCYYIVMEYVSGDTLKDYIHRVGALDAKRTLEIAIDIANALEAAHKNNIIHCDIKPHNILLMDNGHVKVADFGIARAVTSSTLTYDTDVVGSVYYFSPEQAKGTHISPKSDVYSLGVCMYEMLTGKLPFSGESSVSIALKHLQESPKPVRQINPNIPPILEAIVSKAMDKESDMRPSSTELIADLQEALAVVSNKAGGAAEDPFATQVLPRVSVPAPDTARSKPADNNNDKEEVEKGSMFKTKKFWVGLIIILFAGFGVGAFMSYGNFWSATEVSVPDVVGRQSAIAKQILEESNLRVNLAEAYDAEVPEGQVISQYPEAGSKVKEQRTITIYVSKGGEELIMPDLIGMSRENAEAKLARMGIKVTVYEENDKADAGKVIRQDIAAGSKINKGNTIDIIVSKGEKKRTIAVPDYRGMSIDAARANIESNGLSISSVSQIDSKELPGTVLEQTPSAGEKIKEGDSLSLVVSSSSSRANADIDSPEKQDQRAADTAEAQGLEIEAPSIGEKEKRN